MERTMGTLTVGRTVVDLVEVDPTRPDLVGGKATGLAAGSTYHIYRWDSVGEAFTYADRFKKDTFTATSDTYTYADGETFESDGTTYYRVVKAE